MLYSWSPAELEVRAGGRRITGRIGYREKGMLSTGSGRGANDRPLGEIVMPRAYQFSLRQAKDPKTTDDIHLLAAHDSAKPLASVKAGGLELEDTDGALLVSATVVNTREADDTLELIRSGVATGLSVGFMLPPKRRVPNALEIKREPFELDGKRFDPEPDVPGADVRIIWEALLFEISIVTRPAFRLNQAEARAEFYGGIPLPRRAPVWLP